MNKKYILLLCVLIFSASAWYSCDDMNYMHEKYLKDGELAYAENPDSISFVPGNNRIKVLVSYAMPKNLSKCFLYWDTDRGKDSVVFTLPTGETNRIFVDTILYNMKEKKTAFTLKTLDKFGNWSVPIIRSGDVYGEKYRIGLSNRIINDVKAFRVAGKDSIYIYWTTAPFVSDSTVLTYKSSITGSTVEKIIRKQDLVTRLGDYNWKVDTLKRVTFYNKYTALDLFLTNIAELKPTEFLIPKNTFVARALNQDLGNSGSTFYQVLWNDSITARVGSEEVSSLFKYSSNKVYCFTFDMGITTKLSRFVFYPHLQNVSSMPKKFEIWGNTAATWTSTSIKPTDADPIWPNEMIAKGWKLLRTVDLSSTIATSAPVIVGIDLDVNVRYIRIRSLDTFNSDGKTTVLSEIEAYTNIVP